MDNTSLTKMEPFETDTSQGGKFRVLRNVLEWISEASSLRCRLRELGLKRKLIHVGNAVDLMGLNGLQPRAEMA